MLVVIGPRWLTAADPNGRRRLDDPDDLTRLEVAAALRRGIRVVPVLVGGAAMPSGAICPTTFVPSPAGTRTRSATGGGIMI